MIELWIAIAAIGAFTAVTRIAPMFFIGRRKENRERPRAAWLDALGPCLLAAMAAVVILPHVQFSAGERATSATAISFGVVATIMLIRRDPGLATIGGMLVYFLLS